MKVKAGDKVIDAAEQPVMVSLSDQDKENIAKRAADTTCYSSFTLHTKMTVAERYQWMDSANE